MKKFILALIMVCLFASIIISSCTSALAAEWLKFAKDGGISFYYDRESMQCFETFDRNSGLVTGYVAQVWIKPSQDKSSKDNMALWSIADSRKIDKDGGDYPNIYGDKIKPDSMEEKLYKILIPDCEHRIYGKP